MTTRILFSLFSLVALAQLFIPGKMVFDSERALTEGTLYRFRTAPVDPLDYFRGKYVALDYSDVTIDLHYNGEWIYGEEVYAVLGTNDSGFAVIQNIMRDRPEAGDYVKAKIMRSSSDTPYSVTLQYPFNRFYMDENDALDAERAYNKATRQRDAYALVRVRQEDAVLEDIIVDGKPIRQAAEEFVEE